MHYSVQQGVHNTLPDRLKAVPDAASRHNWLPTVVTGITALWVGLVFININQKIPMSHSTPSSAGHVSVKLPMTDAVNTSVNIGQVNTQPAVTSTSNLQATSSVRGVKMRSTGPTVVATMTSQPNAPTADTVQETTSGGYGADEPLSNDGDSVVSTASTMVIDPGNGVSTAGNTVDTNSVDPLVTTPTTGSNSDSNSTGAPIDSPVIAPIIINIDIPGGTPITTSL